MRKKTIIGIVILILVGVSALFSGTRTYSGKVRATLVIEGDQRVERTATLPAGSSVEDLMTACGIAFEREPSGFITSINGVSQDTSQGLYWIYYVNGELGMVGASQYMIKDGDVITWKMEKF